MNLVSLDTDPSTETSAQPDSDSCPKLYLSAGQCKALGLTAPPRVGTQFTLTAVVEVSSAHEYEVGEKATDVSVTLDVDFAALSAPPGGKAAQLYSET